MYKYNIADRNHPIQEVDIQEENLASIFFSVEMVLRQEKGLIK